MANPRKAKAGLQNSVQSSAFGSQLSGTNAGQVQNEIQQDLTSSAASNSALANSAASNSALANSAASNSALANSAASNSTASSSMGLTNATNPQKVRKDIQQDLT